MRDGGLLCQSPLPEQVDLKGGLNGLKANVLNGWGKSENNFHGQPDKLAVTACRDLYRLLFGSF
jgi:hypothetical protein